MPGTGLMCTSRSYRATRPATSGGGSAIQSARPAAIAATSGAGVRPNRHTIWSGNPAGCAAADHWRK